MPSSREAVILVVILFLLVILIYSSVANLDALARKKIPKPKVTVVNKGPTSCFESRVDEVNCCQDVTYSDGLEVTYCTICDNTNPPSNCSERFIKNQGPTNPPPPLNILPPSHSPPSNAPPPPSQTCPGGLAPDANGNCPTTKTNQQVAPSQNLASNNPQPEHQHHKGQDSTTKKDNGGGSQQQAPS